MPYAVSAKHTMLLSLGVTHASAHTGDPGDVGSDEVSGGSYVRASITFNPPAGGAIDSSNTPVLNIPAGNTVTHIGYWTAESGGNFIGYTDIVDNPFASDGTITLTDVDLDLNL